jgi:hypothetical protein
VRVSARILLERPIFSGITNKSIYFKGYGTVKDWHLEKLSRSAGELRDGGGGGSSDCGRTTRSTSLAEATKPCHETELESA